MEMNHYFDPAHRLRPYTYSLPANPDTLPPVNALRGGELTIKKGFWPCEKDGSWSHVEDHRERTETNGFPAGTEQEGAEYWLPGDLPNSPSRKMDDIGPLPADLLLSAPEPPLEEARAVKIAQIDEDTSAAILAGFEYEVSGQTLHFAYDTNDQQNFADTANASTLAKLGVPGLPSSVTWNGWKVEKDGQGESSSRSLVRLTLTPDAFLGLYMGGALVHKATQMEIGGQRKELAETATTLAKLEAI